MLAHGKDRWDWSYSVMSRRASEVSSSNKSRLEHTLSVGFQRRLQLSADVGVKTSRSEEASQAQKKPRQDESFLEDFAERDFILYMNFKDKYEEQNASDPVGLARQEVESLIAKRLTDTSIVEALKDIVDLSGSADVPKFFHPKYGHINDWDVSEVTTMKNLFTELNSKLQGVELSGWDVRRVIDMSYMFAGCTNFTSDLSKWAKRLDRVVTFDFMFLDAHSFTSDLSEWKFQEVNSMKGMFQGARSFRSELNDWPMEGVQDISFMFKDAQLFNCDLDEWSTNSVKTMRSMFEEARNFDGSVNGWDAGNCWSFTNMFKNAINFSGTLDDWIFDGSNVHLYGMFDGAVKYKPTYPIGFFSAPEVDWMESDDFPLVDPSEEGNAVIDVKTKQQVDEGGFTVRLEPAPQKVKDAVQTLMDSVNPNDLTVKNRDAIDTGPGFEYSHMEVQHVLQIERSTDVAVREYEAVRDGIKRDINEKQFCVQNFEEFQCVRTDQAFKDVGAVLPGGPLDSKVSEKLLLHSTNPGATLFIAQNGFKVPNNRSEKSSGSAYGNGVYFAEDAGKCDQYAASWRWKKPYTRGGQWPDAYEKAFAMMMNELLEHEDSDTLYYMLVSRVTLGCAAHVRGGHAHGENIRNLWTLEKAHSQDPRCFHSAIVEHQATPGKMRPDFVDPRFRTARFREFVVKDTRQTLPCYVVVYKRFKDAPRPQDYRSLDCPQPPVRVLRPRARWPG